MFCFAFNKTNCCSTYAASRNLSNKKKTDHCRLLIIHHVIFVCYTSQKKATKLFFCSCKFKNHILWWSLQLKTTTTVACSRDFQEDRIWLNGKEEDISQPRLQACLRESTFLLNLHVTYTQSRQTVMMCKRIYPAFFVPSLFSGPVRRLARKRRNDEDPNAEMTLSHRVHICSVNNFPTAAGLASSAAGYACLGEVIVMIINSTAGKHLTSHDYHSQEVK